MKVTIFKKCVILVSFIIIVPLVTIEYLAINEVKKIATEVLVAVDVMGQNAIHDSTFSLNDLGAINIKQKAVDVAKQIEIYLRSNSQKTVVDLQKDSYFRHFAVQPVGETGYTAITDVATLTCRLHSNPKIENKDLQTLSEQLPGFWSVMSRSRGGIDSSGYYDWVDADGEIRQKYMYIAVVDAKTKDQVQFSVASTTYIDEYSKPMVVTKKKLDAIIQATKDAIVLKTGQIGTISFVIVTILIAIGLAFITSYLFVYVILKPLKMNK